MQWGWVEDRRVLPAGRLAVASDRGGRRRARRGRAADDASLLSLTCHLLALRGCHQALILGRRRSIADAPEGVFAYVRTLPGPVEPVLVALNFRAVEAGLAMPADSGQAHVLASTGDRSNAVEQGTIRLAPLEAIVAVLRQDRGRR